MKRPPLRWLLLAAVVAGVPPAVLAEGLGERLGRSEVRVYAAPFPIEPGGTVSGYALPTRLERLGYRRVRGRRPAAAGEYFWGHELFWIYQRPVAVKGRRRPAQLVGLELERGDGAIVGLRAPAGKELGWDEVWLEPEVVSESLAGDRAPRRPVRLADLPERIWRPVLAAEDARFFDHGGVDARALARALIKNARAGKVVQGGSTITQQLIKVRDLTPKRTFGRKLSEAWRALSIEAEHEKTEILETYLNSIYYGHVRGVAVHGIGAAAWAYFSKSAAQLDLGEAALLAGIVQGPNRLHPERHPERALARQRWVLSRLEELGWAGADELARARRRGLPPLDTAAPDPATSPHFLTWVRDEVAATTPGRVEKKGVMVDTTLDPYLQQLAWHAVSDGLGRLGRRQRGTASAALVALDAATGEVLAHVGGDPGSRRDRFDRVRRARRQPGSTVKPLVLLEAFERCGDRRPLFPSRRVLDRPIRLDLPSGPWAPGNPGGSYRGTTSIRNALVDSLNVPFVRIGRWCGFAATARRFERAGLDLPEPLPPSFVLGAVEASPLDLAAAYTVFANLGRRAEPRPLRRIAAPSGRRVAKPSQRRRKVTSAASAFLVRDLLAQAMADGPAWAARLDGVDAFGKTGTSSDGRDAWFAGGAGSLVTVVWMGRDDGSPLGLSGAEAAAPIWRQFMEQAVPARPPRAVERPEQVVEGWVDAGSGLLVSRRRRGAEPALFRAGNRPPKRRFLLPNRPLPVVE